MEEDNVFWFPLKVVLFINFVKYGSNCIFFALLVKRLWITNAGADFTILFFWKLSNAEKIHNDFTNVAMNKQLGPYFSKTIYNINFKCALNALSPSIFKKISFLKKNYHIFCFFYPISPIIKPSPTLLHFRYLKDL